MYVEKPENIVWNAERFGEQEPDAQVVEYAYYEKLYDEHQELKRKLLHILED